MAEFSIGPFSFGSKSRAEAEVRSIKDSYGDGERVRAEHEPLLRALVGMHPRAQEKIGSGIEYFVVQSNSDLHSRTTGIWIKQLENDNLMKFGYGDIFNPPSRKVQVKEALASAGRPVIEQYRDSRFSEGGAVCWKTGEVITRREEANVVHRNPPWHELTTTFVERYFDGDWSRLETKSTDDDHGQVLVNEEIVTQWREYQGAYIDGLDIERA